MASEIRLISKSIHKHNRSLLEYSISNDTILSNRLLSPIIENSTEIHSTPISINKICSNTSQKILNNIILKNDNLTIDELNHILIQKSHQYMKDFHNIQNYLNKFDKHFKELSNIIEYLRTNKNFTNTIELIETRLLQMHVKRNQIDRLLNQSSIKNLIEKILPYILKSKLIINYNELLTSLQLSMNQKTTLIDHLKNEYRYRKYRLNEYSLKFQQQNELLIKLIKQIQYDKIIKPTNHIFIINQQSNELINLSNEYKQLQNENYLLTLKAKENLQKFSMIIQSNHH
ncbi:unnamed protein product [Rotaria sordida]|uniref:Uncharacterized protein n=1 Tax=Rotaria sordida TaxID=392033 RepID=A0A813T9T5_9BILA|nr:unnamed protein product [Rotaria sordida]CAF0761131.1 unnamed protein product [Rotaria sordida]CAF0776701.1 unnamed protein product [Rotaria sordida]CAF0779077.1 unnamed protein product [Rotaria sordida]CAF0810892.1 unnamed protein product [Rotaria sordida]